jgi:hypothetical protein
MTTNLIFWLNTTYLGLNVLFTLTFVFLLRKIYRKETYAIILSKDGDDTVKKINPNLKKFEEKKQTYITAEKPHFFFKRKGIMVYDENNPVPLEFGRVKNNPKLTGEALYSVVYSEALRILNRASWAAGLDIKKLLMIGGAVLIGYLILSGGFT